MQPKSSFLQKLLKKQFPTLLGIGILVIALIGGIFLLQGNTGVFSPRATPQTTPKNVKVTNLTDTGFTISFLTDESTAGFLKYGNEANSLKNQISDDRDQLSGSIGQFTTHHISLRSLQPNTTYYYVIGTGSGTIFDNAGTAFSIKTLSSGGTPNAAKTVYGKVLGSGGTAASGSIVYVTSPGIGELSSLVNSSASWAIPLSNARSSDGKYVAVGDDAVLTIFVQGETITLKSKVSAKVSEAQPVADITLGSNVALSPPEAAPVLDDRSASDASQVEDAMADDVMIEDNLTMQKSDIIPGGLSGFLTQAGNFEETEKIVDLTASESAKPIVDSMQPTITGKALPSTRVSITINSDTQIQQDVITDANGNFVIDLSQLEQELEPGEHTVTYCYDDPNTSQEVCKTYDFTVADTSTLLAQANTTSSYNNLPYSSGNPYSIGGSTQSATASDSSTASNSTQASGSASKGGIMPSTASGVPVSGSMGTTLALVMGGVFFILSAAWSYYLATQMEEIA